MQEDEGLIAINVLIEPDNTLAKTAKAVNTKLRANYPDGFSFDKTHIPHITLLQCFVLKTELRLVIEKVEDLVDHSKIQSAKLKATGYSWHPKKDIDIGVGVITIQENQLLLDFQKKIIERLHPFIKNASTSLPFYSENGKINTSSIHYVNHFIENAAGENFSPHLTVGLAQQDFLKEFTNQELEQEFEINSISVYQLGNFGTARLKLYTQN